MKNINRFFNFSKELSSINDKWFVFEGSMTCDYL